MKLDYHLLDAIANELSGLLIGRKMRPMVIDMTETHPEVDRVARAHHSGKFLRKRAGSCLSYLRNHLGVRVSEHNLPRLIVNAQNGGWNEGEAVLTDGLALRRDGCLVSRKAAAFASAHGAARHVIA